MNQSHPNYGITTAKGFRLETGLGLLLGALLLSSCSGQSDAPAAPMAPAQPPAAAPDADALVDAAMDALGMDGMTSISVSGTAWRIRNSFRQTRTASPPWPEHDEITNYQRTMDLTQTVSRATGDTFASNLFLEPPVAGTYTQNVASGQTPWGQQLEYWLTPWGFLKGADQYDASAEAVAGEALTMISWQSPPEQVSPGGLRYTVRGYLDGDNRVRRVETWVEDAFMGDMHVVNVYDGYQDMGGALVPATIEQQRGGGGVFGVNVTAATVNPPNAADLLAIPPPPAPPGPPPGGAPAAPAELSEQVGEGVYLIKTMYNALLVEFADHVAVFEAGGSPAVGEAIVAEAARLFPAKPLRYLINSHPHADHTAGMVPVVRAGATIVTHQNNIEFLDMALSTPRTLLGEAPMDPQFMAAGSVTVMEDATRRLELHHIENLHSDGTIVAYLPNERILFQADFTLPVGGAAANPFVVNLAEYVDANGLQFDQYLAVHAANVPQTMADLMAAIGK
jgi:glyoxylase-like metal-dependent hydrolase (beta-lactamase superfamily II)